MGRLRTVAVVGGGIAGLGCARRLQRHGARVRVFDKARRPGGRMSTRRTAEGLCFDHGAQYFTARSSEFRAVVKNWERNGIVAPWVGPFATLGASPPPTPAARFVGKPTMSAIGRHLAEGLSVTARSRIAQLDRCSEGWRLVDDEGRGRGEFEFVAVAVPAAQAVPLLLPSPALLRRAETVEMSPCWAVMVAFETPLPVEFGGARIWDAPVAWAARQRSKPARAPDEAWVLHASPAWTARHWDDDPGDVTRRLVGSFAEAAGFAAPSPIWSTAHRWRFARAPQDDAPGVGIDLDQGLGACGDWCRGSRVEDAWRSGEDLAAAIASAMA